jgi:uncharacterized protein
MTNEPDELVDPEAETLAVLDILLLEYGSDESILNVSELDGFCAALACAPDMILPSTWVPAIWGGVQPDWDSEAEAEDFFTTLFEFYNSIMTAMMSDDYEALFYEREAGGETFMIVDEWCCGFLRGMELWGPLPAADNRVVDEHLEQVRLFATEAGWRQLDDMGNEVVAKAQQQIEPNVRALHRHFLAQRTPH